MGFRPWAYGFWAEGLLSKKRKIGKQIKYDVIDKKAELTVAFQITAQLKKFVSSR